MILTKIRKNIVKIAQNMEVLSAANFQFFKKLVFDYINYLWVRNDHIFSFSWKIQNVSSSSVFIIKMLFQIFRCSTENLNK